MTRYWVIRESEHRGPYDEAEVLEGVQHGTCVRTICSGSKACAKVYRWQMS
jgi:hypothetical protein